MFARPEKIVPEEIRSFQVYLTTEKKLVTGTIPTSNSALRFLHNLTLQRHWVLEEVLPMPQIPDKLPVFSAL
jgi:integrase/recombinase XerD